MSTTAGAPLVEVRDLSVEYATRHGVVRAVRDVSFSMAAGEAVGIVGESGSGKSATALAMMGLLPNHGSVTRGSIRFEGENVTRMGRRELDRVRGDSMAMVYQDPMTALNPLIRVGAQVGEALRVHRGVSAADARRRVVDIFERVEIPHAQRRIDDYPHQFSGGMRQRLVIAMALICGPRLLICDEPTTALDVTAQAQVLELLRRLRQDVRMAMMLITHDLGVIAENVDRVIVMYAGRVVETGSTAQIFGSPAHPYTQGLLSSLASRQRRGQRMRYIAGKPPNPTDTTPGCGFWARCPVRADPRCETTTPALRAVGPGHLVASFCAPPTTAQS